jgi:hypothetical protein
MKTEKNPPYLELIAANKNILTLSDIGIPEESWLPFSRDLVKMPNFSYRSEQMKASTRFLLQNEFSSDKRYPLLERLTRRSTMEEVDISRRMGIWRAIDEITPKACNLRFSIDKYGRDRTLADLESMQKRYLEVLFPEFERLKEEWRDYSKKRRQGLIAKSEDDNLPLTEATFLSEVYENHVQETSVVFYHTVRGLIEELK